MTYTQYYALLDDAMDYPDREAFAASRCLTDSMLSEIRNIWDLAHMTVRDLCKASSLSQTALAKRFGIPLRTVQDWCLDARTPPPYIFYMMADLLGLVHVERHD